MVGVNDVLRIYCIQVSISESQAREFNDLIMFASLFLDGSF